MQHMKHVIQSRDGKMILHGDLIDCTTMNTIALTTILLWCYQGGYCTGTKAFQDKTAVE